MTTSEVSGWIAAVAAFIAACVAFWQARAARAAARSAELAQGEANRIQAEMLTLQKQDAADREARARQTKWDVVVEVTHNRYNLIVESLGPAPAQAVSILVDGKQPEAWGLIRDQTGKSDLMEEGAQLRFDYLKHNHTLRPSEITVSWTDSSGERQGTSRAPRIVGRQ